jgi:hypothetical protein
MSTARRNWIAGFYWMGVAMALACLALVLAGNTDLMWRFEHSGFPLSWALAGAAILAFLATEFFDSSSLVPCNAEDPSSRLSAEWETAEF